MSFESNRMDFEKALLECKEIFDAMDVLIKPEILNTLISMIEEYQIHYSRDIDEMVNEVAELHQDVADKDEQINILEHEIDNYGKLVKTMKQESLDSDKI